MTETIRILSRDDILTANDIKYEVVEVPEWGGSVRVKSITGAERDQFEGSVVTIDGKKTHVNTQQFRAKLVALAVVDGDGQRLFDESDVMALSSKNAAPLDRVFTVAQRLAGLSDDDIETLEKN